MYSTQQYTQCIFQNFESSLGFPLGYCACRWQKVLNGSCVILRSPPSVKIAHCHIHKVCTECTGDVLYVVVHTLWGVSPGMQIIVESPDYLCACVCVRGCMSLLSIQCAFQHFDCSRKSY